jgi:hypothetical protein
MSLSRVVEPLVGGMPSNVSLLIPPWKLKLLWLVKWQMIEVVWLNKFLMDLGVMRIEHSLFTLFCNNIVEWLNNLRNQKTMRKENT